MSLALRALVAILLMVGFYLLALGVAGGLLWISYTQWQYSDHLNLRLAVFCAVSAAVILWSILPRLDRFEAPGPRIDASQQPQLFTELSKIAQSVNQVLPDEVYLVPEVNAWVAQRGGFMGFGSRRVMALGLPLMALVTVSQFRAVLTHEFGHYYGGDTKLGPWIYKTRGAIGRTLHQLSRRNSWLVILFKWYGTMFLRITLAISRAQEFAADRLAAQMSGSKALTEGLKQLYRGTAAWQFYLKAEVVPILSSGYAPPLAMGLMQFLQAPNIKQPVEEGLSKELAEGKADPLDSHPALSERIAAVQDLPQSIVEDTRNATDLLADFNSSDTSLFGEIVSHAPLKAVRWEQVLAEVWVPQWRQTADYQSEALRSMTVADLPEQFSNGAFVKRIKNPPGVSIDLPERVDIARGAAGCALSLALLQDGWTFHVLPGEMYCEKAGQRLEPFQLIQKLDRRQITPEQWKNLSGQAGISNLQLTAEDLSRAAAKR